MSQSATWISVWGDCQHVMPPMPAGGFQLVFADPPFNIGYDYDVYKDKLGEESYLDWCRRWMSQVYRLLADNGTFWLAIGDEYAAELKCISKELGFICRNWVIWYYTFGVHCKTKFNRSHTHLFYFVKHKKDFTWNRDALLVPSARAEVYRDNRAAAGGKTPDDVWNFSRLCGTFKERTSHPCQMPEAILKRIILACSNEGDTILDPFAGSGTTLAVAQRLNRNSIGIELSAAYCEIIRERLEEQCGTKKGEVSL